MAEAMIGVRLSVLVSVPMALAAATVEPGGSPLVMPRSLKNLSTMSLQDGRWMGSALWSAVQNPP